MVTLLGDQMSEAHRAEQIRLVRPLVTAASRHAAMIVPSRPATLDGYAALVGPQIRRARAQSNTLAGNYYNRLRQVEARGRFTPITFPEADDPTLEERFRRSIDYFAGTKYARRLEAGVSEERASEQLRVDIAGAAIRNTLNGGRDGIRQAVINDSVATGYVRVTAMDSRVCWFCAMLASRRDYKGDSFDKSDPRFKLGGNPFANAKVHDHCRCMLRPVFDYEVPERNQWLAERWDDVADTDPDNLAHAWRAWWESQIASGSLPWQGATGA